MIFATFGATVTAEAVTDDTGGRLILGTAVPWDEWGRVSDGTMVRFAAGSLSPTPGVIVAMGHDASRPIGKVTTAASTPHGLDVTVRVSAVRDGDEALILAADGILGSFSVGVNPTAHHEEATPDGETGMVVTAGDWHHLALLPFGAFPSATVTDVAASAPTTGEPMPETIAPAEVEAAPPAVVPVAAAAPALPPLTLGALSAILAAGNQENLRAAEVAARIEAALTNVTTANVPSPPTYRTELVGLIDHGTPLVSRFDSRPLPATGMEILYPKWVAFPDSTAIQATEKTAIASGDVSWTWATTPVLTFAQGNDLSLQAVQRSSPSAMDAYLRAAAIDAARKWDKHVADTVLAAAEPVTAGADFLANVAALFGGLSPTDTPPGRIFLALAWDAALPLITMSGLEGPALWDASINLGEFLPGVNASGMDIFIDPNLPAGTWLMGVGTGAATYGGSTLTDIRVVDVSLLGVDVGVYFNAAVVVEYPGAFAKIAPVIP